MSASFEREFLVRLAPVWFACRWRVMGHPLIGQWPNPELAFDLLGMCDYAAEMRIIAQHELRRLAQDVLPLEV